MPTRHLHDDPERTTPIGLARYACEFMEAALAADDKMGRREGHEIVAPVPVMFLVGQSVELALKAFLLSKGIPLSKLRQDYGHELHRSLRKAKELGLFAIAPLADDELETIELLDLLYSSKQLQYIVSGVKTFPVFGPLERATLRLLHGVCPAVGFSVRHLPNVL
jgi:hypothetical protein